VEFLLSDWFQGLAGRRFDVVVSNPPYLREQDAHLQQGDVRFEPRDALVAGADGLTALRQISGAACAHLNPNGRLVLEHGFDQAAQVQTLLGNNGYRAITSYLDLAGHTRVAEACAP
jgi:release factor glutamine methyltransferase